MSQLVKIIISVGRIAVVLFTVMALGVSGASGAARLFSICPLEDLSSDVTYDYMQLIPDVSETEKAADTMAPGSRPFTEQDACFESPIFLKAGNDKNQLASNYFIIRNFILIHIEQNQNSHPVSTVNLVSSATGRNLTLVGAKPSGTS
ncbi:MAG: hypothetical protein ACOYVF_11775 [Candidatus Zixiibacteriota bacterium]